MKRILEPEVMVSRSEAQEYDRLTLKYAGIVDEGFAESACKLGPAGGKALDIGAGTGRIPIMIAQKNPDIDIEGVDLSPAMLTIAQENVKGQHLENRITFSCADAKALPYQDNTFDMVICHNTFHHFPEPLGVLKEILRVVKDEGAVLIRDLIRPWFPKMYVRGFGMCYDRIMRKLYYESLCAAFTMKEIRVLIENSLHSELCLYKYFLTHWSIERPHARPNPHYTPAYPNSLTKMYISKNKS